MRKIPLPVCYVKILVLSFNFIDNYTLHTKKARRNLISGNAFRQISKFSEMKNLYVRGSTFYESARNNNIW